jgi:hypothetical protein
MTIAEFAIALRGVSRDSTLLIDMPDGPVELKNIRSSWAFRKPDGSLGFGAGPLYTVILCPTRRTEGPDQG